MKIVHISTGRTFRGGERQIEWLHEGLLRLGHESCLICRKGSALGDQNILDTFPVQWNGQADIVGLLNIFFMIIKNKPHIIHCHDAHAAFHGAIIGWVLRIPVIAARRVVVPIGRNILSRWKYRHCERIVAVSSAVAQMLEPVVGAERIRVVHDGVDFETAMSLREDACRELGLDRGRLIVGTVGHFTEEKNVALIARLADALVTTHPEVQVVCVGPMQPDVDTFLRKSANLRTTGRIHQPVHIYSAFDIYVSTSRQEGLGTALLDAMVRDIPVVATDAGGTRDLFPPGHVLISPDDVDGFVRAVAAVIEDLENKRIAAKKAGCDARAKFSLEKMVEGTVGVYKELVKE